MNLVADHTVDQVSDWVADPINGLELSQRRLSPRVMSHRIGRLGPHALHQNSKSFYSMEMF